MKKSGLLKSLVVVLLSGVLVANLATFVFAEDNLSWDDLSGNTSNVDNTGSTGNGSLDNNALNSDNNALNTNSNNTSLNENNQKSGSLSTKLDTKDTNENANKDKNELAYTGFADNSILPIMMVLGVLVTIYSVKKIKEYNF